MDDVSAVVTPWKDGKVSVMRSGWSVLPGWLPRSHERAYIGQRVLTNAPTFKNVGAVVTPWKDGKVSVTRAGWSGLPG